jgi:hypothetical protein
MSLPFPETGYVKSVVPLDCWIQITTEARTDTRCHRAVILIGNTNYKIMPGDIVYWGDGTRNLYWAPDCVTLPQAVEERKKGAGRHLDFRERDRKLEFARQNRKTKRQSITKSIIASSS